MPLATPPPVCHTDSSQTQQTCLTCGYILYSKFQKILSTTSIQANSEPGLALDAPQNPLPELLQEQREVLAAVLEEEVVVGEPAGDRQTKKLQAGGDLLRAQSRDGWQQQ